MAAATRSIDVLLWGATGFTGALVVEYFARNVAHSSVRWAVGGRSDARVRATVDRVAQLVAADGVRLDVASLERRCVADPSDEAAMRALVRDVRVVVSTAGPFWRYGRALARACALEGTHYADITGETHFVRWSADTNDADARRTGARLVHCAGFDSAPSDLAAFLAARHCTTVARVPPRRIDGYCVRAEGGPSGGTLHTMLDVLSLGPATLQAISAQHYLNAGSSIDDAPRDEAPDTRAPFFSRDLGHYAGFWVMAAVNSRIVRRSLSLDRAAQRAAGRDARSMLDVDAAAAAADAAAAAAAAKKTTLVVDAASTPPCIYAEHSGMGKSYVAHLLTAVVLGFVALVGLFSWGRRVLALVAPAPGTGPSRAAMENGKFTVVAYARDAQQRLRARAVVKGFRDPGYMGTALLVAECGLSLLELARRDDASAHASVAAVHRQRGGVLTVSTAVGPVLIERLRAAGMQLDVESISDDENDRANKKRK